MNAKINNNYQGDSAWCDYIETIRPVWEKCSDKARLIDALGGQEDLAMAAYFTAGEYATAWVDKPIPALGMLTPRLCVQNAELKIRLRGMLMSAPS